MEIILAAVLDFFSFLQFIAWLQVAFQNMAEGTLEKLVENVSSVKSHNTLVYCIYILF